MLELTGNDLTDMAKSALREALLDATQQDRQEYLQWATEMAPLVTMYATLAATGNPKSQEMLDHLKAQAIAKLWVIADAEDVSIHNSITHIASVAASVMSSILVSLVSKYGVVLLGLA